MLSDELKNIIGDYPHPFLHAKILGFAHPITGQELFFETPPPKIFSDVLSAASLETP
jgi:23S rRNA pseudouridine1911/1915/1917 synthase